jgi:hypothetical protein
MLGPERHAESLMREPKRELPLLFSDLIVISIVESKIQRLGKTIVYLSTLPRGVTRTLRNVLSTYPEPKLQEQANLTGSLPKY